jgi:FkbM family methyltransferase
LSALGLEPRGINIVPPLFISLARTLIRLPFNLGRWRVERFISDWAKSHPIKTTAIVVGGIKMSLDTSDFLQRTLFATGDFDAHIRQAIQKHLKRGDVFVDIGANVGFYALCASKIVGPSGKIFAFEPAPETRKTLCSNILLNGARNISAVQLALADHTGEASLFLDQAHNAGATSMRASPNASREITVEIDTYDNYAAHNKIPQPALIKIDVEGAECLVLKGMANLLSQPERPAMIIEVSELALKQLGGSKEELFAIMEENGYLATLLSSPRRSIFSTTNVYLQYDVLFEPI